MRPVARRTAWIAALATTLACGCGRGVRGTELGPADAPRRILVAVYPTEYKQEVARGLAERYRDRARITLASVQDLRWVDPGDYDALVVIDQWMAWQAANFESGAFVRKAREEGFLKKVVLFLTTGSPKAESRFQGVDCITGATALGREAEAVDALAARVDPLVAPPAP